MGAQADVSKFRWSRIDVSGISRQSAPGQGLNPGATEPDFVLGPFTVSKMATTGFLLQLSEPTTTPAVAGAGGFTVTVWLRDPATGNWSAFDDISIDYQELFVTYDIDAAEIWFQVENVSSGSLIDFGIAEQ